MNKKPQLLSCCNKKKETVAFSSVSAALFSFYLDEEDSRQAIKSCCRPGLTGTSKAKVEVGDICLNISFDLIFQFFYSYETEFKVFSKKNRSLDISPA